MLLTIPYNTTQEEFLVILSKNKNITRLNCSHCYLLTEIPVVEGLKYLVCHLCDHLTKISVIKGLIHLDCGFCPMLTEVPVIESLKKLYCYHCDLLTKIPNIKNIEVVGCSGCPALAEILSFEKLIHLICNNCPNLKNIGIYPNLKGVHSNIPKFTRRNKYLCNLQIIGPRLYKILRAKQAGGFTVPLMNLLDSYS